MPSVFILMPPHFTLRTILPMNKKIITLHNTAAKRGGTKTECYTKHKCVSLHTHINQ